MVEARTIHPPVSENPTFPREIPTSLALLGMTYFLTFTIYRYRSKTITLRRGHATRPTGGNRYTVPFNGGIATPVCALVRNDVLIVVRNDSITISYPLSTFSRLSLFGDCYGQDDLGVGFPAFGDGGDAGALDFLQALGHAVEEGGDVGPAGGGVRAV